MSADAAAHRRLVEAIRADTIRAAGAARGVARVLLVTDAADAAETVEAIEVVHVVQHSPGLNGALRDGAAHAASRWPEDGIAVLVGDLPALRSAELAETLAAATVAGGGFVPDAAGTGTTLLAVVPGVALSPAFGTDSAARHGRMSAALPAGPGLRLDVDTAEDLRAAAHDLGVGEATRQVLAATDSDGAAPAVATCSPSIGMIGP